MHLYRFTDGDDEIIVSAPSQLKAIEIYEGDTGKAFVSVVSHTTNGEPHMTPNQQYGNLIFSFAGDLPTGLPATAMVCGTDDESCAVADADAWAEHWPNRVIEFVQVWGEQ